MTLVAPVNLAYNIKTLWFDPKGLNIHPDDKLVVKTARGVEMGTAAGELIEVSDEQIASLKSSLQPVLRIATEEDIEKAREMDRLSAEALPIFKEMARETSEDMHPVSVEYMLDGDKAVFYFEAEKRIDFRELVRKLASTFHVRIDMRQIGVRDEARIVGGVAHCGQIVCCKRLGGEFKPVSIRMAKDQDLSLNSQKISGLCGRLMCCLRYEEDAYKEFKSHAPKVDARVRTPDGEGRIVEHDVPRDMVSIKAGDSKPIKVPVSAIEDVSKDRKSCAVDADVWQDAVDEANTAMYGTMQMIELPSFTGEDKLGSGKAVHHETSKGRKKSGSESTSEGRSSKGSGRRGKKSSGSGSGSGSGSARRRGGSKGADGGSSEGSSSNRRARRRSTKISGASGEKETVSQVNPDAADSKAASSSKPAGSGASGSSKGKGRSGKGAGSVSGGKGSSRKGSGNGSQKGSCGKGERGANSQSSSPKDSSKNSRVRPGQKSSGLAQGRAESAGSASSGSSRQGGNGSAGGEGASGGGKRRRRRRRSGSSGQGRQDGGSASGSVSGSAGQAFSPSKGE